MLKKINEGEVNGDNFSIQIIGPELLEYKQGGKVIEFDLAYNPKQRKTYVYISKANQLSEIDKKRIAMDIEEAIKFLVENFEII